MLRYEDSQNGVILDIDREVVNTFTMNPFQFPRPDKMSPVMDNGKGKKIPNIAFTFMLEFLHRTCMKKLMLDLRRELTDAFDKSNDGTKDISVLALGDRPFKKNVYIGFWTISAQIVPTSGTFKYADLCDVIDIFPKESQNFFRLSILDAKLKPKPENKQRNPISKSQLTSNATRT